MGSQKLAPQQAKSWQRAAQSVLTERFCDWKGRKRPGCYGNMRDRKGIDSEEENGGKFINKYVCMCTYNFSQVHIDTYN